MGSQALLVQNEWCCYELLNWTVMGAYYTVIGATHAVMCGVSCNNGHGKPTTGLDDDGRSGG